VHAHHFCKASDVRRQDVGEVIRSLAYQLALRFPAFGDALLALDLADAESLSDPARAWKLLLKQPLQALRGTRVVLLFDALDEAGGTDRAISKVLSLVLDLGRIAGGAALSVIVTTRPEECVLKPLHRRWRDSARNFAPAALRDSGQQEKLLALLCSQPPRTIYASVDAAYSAIFDAAAAGAGVQRLLSILMAARQPPSLALLQELGVRGACAALPGRGLLFQEREHCVHVLHKSLSEWLLDTDRSGDHAVDVTAGHRLWADLLSTQLRPWLESGTPALAPPSGSYAYAHLLPHLIAAERGAEARAMLLQLPWLQVTLRERSLYALLSDVAERMVNDSTLSLLHRTLRLSAPGLQGSDAAEALPGQLVGRLGGLLDAAAPEITQLYEAAHSWRGALAWLRLVKATLPAPNGALEMSLEGHTHSVTCMVALADGRMVSGSEDATLRVWNAATGECERTLEGHFDNVESLVALADGRVVSGSHDNTLRVWNVATGECELKLRGHTERVKCLVVLADGRVVSGSQDTTLRVWNTATGECERTLRGHTRAVMSLVSLVEGHVVSGSQDTTLRVWNTATGECERTLEGHALSVTCMVALADGRLVSGSGDKMLRVWNAATGECERTLKGHTDDVMSLAVLADGHVVSGSRDNTLRVWNATMGESELTLRGHKDRVTCLVALTDGRLVSGSGDRTLCVWNAATGECERMLKGHTDQVTLLVALADGRVVSGSRDNTLRVWNAATGECERTLEGHTRRVTLLVALADGRMVSGSDDKMLRVWNAASGECERTLEGHTRTVMSLVSLADGRVVSGSYDKTLRVWNAATGECEHTLEGHTHGVRSVEALADGRVVSRSLDSTMRVWNTASERLSTAGECEQLLQRGSGGAAFMALPRRTVQNAVLPPRPAAISPIVNTGTSLVCEGIAETYVDAEVTHVLALPSCHGGSTTRDKHEVIAASTAAGTVHFFTLRAARHD
jgi:WD40 repeat protein